MKNGDKQTKPSEQAEQTSKDLFATGKDATPFIPDSQKQFFGRDEENANLIRGMIRAEIEERRERALTAMIHGNETTVLTLEELRLRYIDATFFAEVLSELVEEGLIYKDGDQYGWWD